MQLHVRGPSFILHFDKLGVFCCIAADPRRGVDTLHGRTHLPAVFLGGSVGVLVIEVLRWMAVNGRSGGDGLYGPVTMFVHTYILICMISITGFVRDKVYRLLR